MPLRRALLVAALALPAAFPVRAGTLVDACTLVDPAAATAALGGAFTAKDKAVLTRNEDSLWEKSGDCLVAASGGKAKVYVVVFVARDADGAKASFAANQKAIDDGKAMPGVKAAPLPGLGDRAFTYHYAYGPGMASQDTTVSAIAGRKLVTLSLRNAGGDVARQTDQAKALAAHVLAKL
ncbi:MAG: hypothetical protein U1F10_10785 [Burkholderiales bacterium]